MKTCNLMLHCGSQAVTRGDLEGVQTPRAPATPCPIPHNLLVNKVHDSLTAKGFRIITEAHALHREGARYFGLMQVALGQEYDEDYSLVVGMRNGNDKVFP